MRVDKVTRLSSKDADVTIAWFEVPQAPDIGETIGVHGDPYVVISRGWAYDGGSRSGGCPNPPEFATSTFCYIRAMPAPGVR